MSNPEITYKFEDSDKDSLFCPSQESLEHMRFFVGQLPDVQEKFPQVKGVAFFGSRTIGRERSSPPSDLDSVVFYDGTEFQLNDPFEIFEDKIYEKKGVTEDPFDFDSKRSTERKIEKRLNKIQSEFYELMVMRGLPIEFGKTGVTKTVLPVDISEEATRDSVDSFIHYVRSHTDYESGNFTHTRGVDSRTFPLVSRFLNGAGVVLLKNREETLDLLEREKDGERLFSGLMACLKGLRRDGLPEVKDLPKTISEARSYFRESKF